MSLTLADVELLRSPGGRALLDGLPPYDPGGALALAQRLRDDGHDAPLVAAVLTQARLRARARAKLGDVGARLLLSADGLEQATRPQLAARHAARFVAAGVHTVWDLGCGLGLDALAFADAGLAVRAVEADAATAALAAENLRGRPDVRVLHARAQDVELPAEPGIGVWFDPARRLPGRTDSHGRTRRTFRLDQLEPGWDVVQAAAATGLPVGAKLSPAFGHAQVPPGAQAQWVSLDGEVLECAIWFGRLAVTPGRGALVLRAGRSLVGQEVHERDAAGARPPGSLPPRPGMLLFDPDRAVVRAGLVGALAVATDGAELAEGSGYVVADDAAGDSDGAAPEVPWARRYRVRDVLPTKPKAVRAALRAHGVGAVTIKKRGTPVDPDAFRSQLGRRPGTGDEGILVLSSTPQGPVTLLVEAAEQRR